MDAGSGKLPGATRLRRPSLKRGSFGRQKWRSSEPGGRSTLLILSPRAIGSQATDIEVLAASRPPSRRREPGYQPADEDNAADQDRVLKRGRILPRFEQIFEPGADVVFHDGVLAALGAPAIRQQCTPLFNVAQIQD